MALSTLRNLRDITQDGYISIPLQAELSAKQDLTEKGIVDGYAPLDENTLIPTIYIPDTPTNIDGGDLGA